MTRPWSTQEEKLLLFEIKNKIDPIMVTKYHKRTIEDIDNQVINIATKMIDNNISFRVISKITNLDESIIRKIYVNKYSKQQSLFGMIKSIKNDLDMIKQKLDI